MKYFNFSSGLTIVYGPYKYREFGGHHRKWGRWFETKRIIDMTICNQRQGLLLLPNTLIPSVFLSSISFGDKHLKFCENLITVFFYITLDYIKNFRLDCFKVWTYCAAYVVWKAYLHASMYESLQWLSTYIYFQLPHNGVEIATKLAFSLKPF